MKGLAFSEFPLWLNAAIFVGAAVFVWFAGSRLADYADEIAKRTGLNKAFLGMLLLGVATSLPEIATTITGSWIGNARMVSGNLFGGVALQIAILAIVDLILVRGALTYFTPQPILLFQAVMLLLLLAVTLGGIAAGEPISFLNIGLTPLLLLVGYAFTLRMSQKEEFAPRWHPTDKPKGHSGSKDMQESQAEFSSTRLYTYVGLCSIFILTGGWLLALTGDALSEQTNLGASFIGVAFVAWSTSMPELSTTLSAARRGNHQMAVSNILGTNCLEVALFFLADVIYREGPILAEVDRSAVFAAALGMVLTCLFLVGLLERRDRTIMRMGWDSVAVLVFYLTGLGVLYYLK